MLNIILTISVAYAVTLLVRYYINKIQKLNNLGDRSLDFHRNSLQKLGIYQKHNLKYSEVCKSLKYKNDRLQEKNNDLILEFDYQLEKIMNLENKIKELENNKIKLKPKK